MSCATRHPHLPPLHFTSSSCLHCTLHTLQNPRALPTLRRAAAAALTVLPSSTSAPLSHPTAELLLKALIHTLFHTPFLHHDLLPLCVSLARSPHFPSDTARSILISSCTQAICHNQPPPPAIPLLSALLAPCPSPSKQAPSLVPVASADALCAAVLRHASADYAAASHVVRHVIVYVSPHMLRSLPPLLEAALPPRPCDPSRILFLQTALHLYTSRLPFEPHRHPVLNRVLCASFISAQPPVRELAASLFRACFETAALPNAFEYLIEGLRDANLPPLRSKRNALVKPNLAALTLVAPSAAPLHWCYALRTVLAVAEYAHGAVPHLSRVVNAAVAAAPPSVFAAALVPELVAFVMRLMPDQNLAHAAQCLPVLLRRYKPSVPELHAIVGVLECLVEKHLRVAAPIVPAAVAHFQTLAADNNIPRDELQPLARRLVLVIFDRCATQLEHAPDAHFDMEHVVTMFSDGLHQAFIQAQACSEQDRTCIQSWCWRFFPPRRVFTSALDSVPVYLWRISAAVAQTAHSNDVSTLSSEQAILAELAGEKSMSPFAPAFILLDKAVQLHRIDDICLPEAVLEALLRYMRRLESDDITACEKLMAHALRILRLISSVCHQNGLCFPADDIKEQTLQNILQQAKHFSFSDEADRIILHAVITNSKRGPPVVSAWDTIATKYRNPQNVNCKLDDLLTSVVVDQRGSESILYALAHSFIPDVIVESVLDIFERKNAFDILMKALTECGALSSVCNFLKSRPHQGIIPASEAKSSPNIAYNRSKSFLLLISSAGSIPDCEQGWDLLRVVCDTFTRESISDLESTARIDILSHLVRCIIALLRGLEDSGKISFIRHSGVEAQAIKLFTSVPTASRASGILISSIACLLNLFMHKTDLVVRIMPELPINLEFLTEPKTWERLLTPELEPGGVDETNRIANSWYLLNSLLRGAKGNIASFQSILTPNVIVLLHIAAASLSPLLAEAAFYTLRTILQFKYHKQTILCHTGVFKGMCELVVANFLISEVEQLISSEILYLSELARNAFIDEHLPESLEHISDWCRDHEGAGRELPLQPMFNEMSTLFAAISERLQVCKDDKGDFGKTKPSTSHENLKMKFSGASDTASTRECAPDVLLGRYTMIWRISGPVRSNTSPCCQQLEDSNA